jgi:rhamnosyltransferase
MSVSVVIPTLNAGPLFKEVLDAVHAQEFPEKIELVIVDSMSEDGTAELAQKYADVFFQVKREEFNHGATRNLAIEKSSGDLVALLVQDATPADKHWLKNLADDFSDATVAGAYSRQIPRPDCYPLIKLRLMGWGAGQAQKRVQKFDPSKKLSIQETIETFSFDNVSSMVRRSVWEENRFKPRRFAEDILWAKEVLEKGHKIVFDPGSAVIHSHNKSLWYEFKRVYLDHQNWWQVGNFRVFNRRIELIGASFDGTIKAVRGITSLGLPTLSLLGWTLYAPFFVFSQNLAQYMGSWADRWKEKYSWYYRIDGILSKGV